MADLRNRLAIEAAIQQRLDSLSAKHREELLSYLGNPPDLDRVPDEFWEKVEREERERLILLLLIVFSASAIQHGERFGLDRDQVAGAAEEWAAVRAAEVAEGYARHSRELAETAASRWAQSEGMEMPATEVAEDISRIFGTTRDRMIAINETAAAATAGGEYGIAATAGRSEDDTWYTADDARVCPVCSPLHGVGRSVWSSYFPEGPPAHVVCRCWIVYAAESMEVFA